MQDNSDILLEKMRQMFYRGSHNFFLQPDDISLMTWDWQQKFLDATVHSNLLKKYPKSSPFTKLFLKKVIGQLEGYQDVHDDLYSNLCHAMNSAEDGYCYRHYLISEYDEIITIKETNKMVVNGTTGMRTWEAALMLADWALSHRETFNNKNILELGSGVGFTGITIGKLCNPKSIYLSDCHSDVMKAICDNISINFPESQVTESNEGTFFINDGRTVGALPLDWNCLGGLSNKLIPDIVIGADIVYDPSILQPLCDVLKILFDRNIDLEVYIASVIRNEDTFQLFLQNLDSQKFRYQKISLNESIFLEWDRTVNRCLLKINYCH